MKVTVILVTYNHEDYIAEAIESVLGQTTDFDFEIVIIEDCSTDTTRAIVEKYGRRHPDRITLMLAERNLCDNTQMMEAWRRSGSPYIALLEGDDCWISREKLAKQVSLLDAHPEYTMAFHNALVVCEDRCREPYHFNAADQGELIFENLLGGNIIATCSVMYRHQVVPVIPEWFNGLQDGADWTLHLLHARLGSAGYVNDVLGKYRKHSRGLWSGAGKIGQLRHVIRFYEGVEGRLGLGVNGIVSRALGQQYDELAREHARAGDLLSARACVDQILARGRGALEGVSAKEVEGAAAVEATLRKRRWLYAHPTLYAMDGRWARVTTEARGRWRGLLRRALRRSEGTIVAEPNPVRTCDTWVGVKTTLAWDSHGTTEIEIHVGAPTGPLFCRSGPTGSATTGDWVTDGMVFYLQDVAGGRPLDPANTIATVTVGVVATSAA